MTEDSSTGEGKQVIARVAQILKALENKPQGLTLSQLARDTLLPRTTVHRMITALEAQQLVMSAPTGVKLGPAIVRLAASAHTDLISIARPFIEALGRRTRETVDLSVYRGIHALSVDQYASDQELRVISVTGTAFPCYCTAHGKALLAERSDQEITTLFDSPLEKRTPHSINNIQDLLTQLADIRNKGFAIDNEEHALGVCGIGVYLRCGLPEQYALSIAVPSLRFHNQLEFLCSTIMQCRAEIESHFGKNDSD